MEGRSLKSSNAESGSKFTLNLQYNTAHKKRQFQDILHNRKGKNSLHSALLYNCLCFSEPHYHKDRNVSKADKKNYGASWSDQEEIRNFF